MKFLASLGLIFLLSCNKEKNTTSDTLFINSTPHVIKVSAYIGGMIDQKLSFELEPNEISKVYHNNTRGINNGISYGYGNMPIDSFVATFDNAFSIAHYKPNMTGNNPKRYLYESKRNIYNDSSYTLTVKKETEI